MFRVSIIDNEQVIKSVVSETDENTRIAWAQEGETSLGYCVFKTDGEILKIDNRRDMYDVIVRAVLNHLDLKDIHTAYSKTPKVNKFLKLMGFSEENGICTIDITEFFARKCKNG